jgi:hypothetical protein
MPIDHIPIEAFTAPCYVEQIAAEVHKARSLILESHNRDLITQWTALDPDAQESYRIAVRRVFEAIINEAHQRSNQEGK